MLAILTQKPAEMIASKFIEKNDGFNARVLITILCNVLLMSVALAVIGGWIGTGHISMAPIYNFFYNWPRNFAISFGVELLIAQPIARFVMMKFHQTQN